MKTLIKKAVINTLAASGANLHTDSVTGVSKIVVLNTTDPLVPIIPYEIKAKSVKNVRYITGAEEVRRNWTVGVEDTETIVASTKYSIGIDYAQYKTDSTRRASDSTYGYTSPAVLTSAVVDRTNVYTALNTKINAHFGNFVTSALIAKVAFTGGTSVGDVTEALVVGEVATQATSGATGIVVKLEITSGTLAGDDAAGFFWVHTITGTWSAASLATTFATSTSVTITTAALLTEGQGLNILDDANYWISTDGRGGASSVETTNGFTATTPYIDRDVTYAQGQGDVMLALAPVYDYKKDDIISGQIEAAFNQTPVSTKSYTLAIIEIDSHPESQAGGGYSYAQQVELHLYMDESNGTNLTNLKTPLTALIGL